MINEPKNQRDLAALKKQRDIVALEGFFDANINLSERFASIFPSVADTFSGFVARFSNNHPTVALTSKQRDFQKVLAKHSYIDMHNLTVYTPEGMDSKKATYLDYGMALSGAVERALNVEKTLNAYTLYLSKFITNREQKLSMTNSERVYKDLEKDRARVAAALGTFFKDGSHETEAAYGDMIKRNADWAAVFGLCDKLSTAVESVSRSVLMKKVQETATLMDRIIGMAKRKELEGITPEAMQELANGAYQVASELEFFSVMHYRTLAFVEGVNRTVLRLNEVLK